MNEEQKTGKKETVLVSEDSEDENEFLDEKTSNSSKGKKREWTAKREIAWQKCLEGKKQYEEVRKKLKAQEDEEKKFKEKVRLQLLEQKIRSEIEAELREANKKDSSDIVDVELDQKITDTNENNSEEAKNSSQTNNVVSKTKKRKEKESYEDESEESSESSDSEEENRKRRKSKKSKKSKKRNKKTKRKHYYSSESDSESSEDERVISKPIYQTPPAPKQYSYLKNFAFV